MESICRLCGESKPQSQIKCSINDKSLNIEQKLFDCCRWILYQSYENLPDSVCESCFTSLENSWKFAEAVGQAQQKLADELKSMVIQQEDRTSPMNIKVEVGIGIEIKDEMLCDIDSNEIQMVVANELDAWFDDNELGSSEEETQFLTEASVEKEVEKNSGKSKKSSGGSSKLRPRKSKKIRSSKANKEPKNDEKVEDDTLESFMTYDCNYPECVSADDRNSDGTVKAEAIDKLKICNWTIFQHQCNVCNACFNESYDLNRHHKREHCHSELRYKCWLCKESKNLSYSKRTVLFRHIVRHHIPHLAYWFAKIFF